MKKILILLLLSYTFGQAQSFTEISPTAHSADGSGIFVNTTGYRTANDITVYPNVDFTLNSISFNAVLEAGGSVDSVSITYYDDNGGIPGNIIATQNDLVPTSQNVLYHSQWGDDIREVVLDINPVLLNGSVDQATTYWISLVATVSNSAIVWWELTQGSTTGDRIYEYLPSQNNWVRKGYGDGVYEFSGTMSPMSGLSCNPINGNPEDFETADITTHCWSLYNEDNTDPGFVQTSAQSHQGGFSFYHACTDLTTTASSYLVSPAISASFFDVLSFWYYQHNTANYGISEVLISKNSSDPINNPADFTTLVSLDDTALGGFSEDTWTKHVESLRHYAGETIYIAFKYSGDMSHELYIDDFSVAYDNMLWDEASGALHVNVLAENADIYTTDSYVIGSNLNATNSSTINGTPSCGSFNGGDIWFKFTAPATGAVQLVYPTITSFGFSEVGHALYDNPLSTTEFYCGINGNFWNEMPSDHEEFVYFTHLISGKTYYLRVWDSNNDNFGNVYFCLKAYTDTSSVEETNMAKTDIYPNPTNGIVNLRFEETPQIGNVSVVDMLGRTVYKEELKSSLNHKIDISTQDSGVYFLFVNINHKRTAYKIIKE